MIDTWISTSRYWNRRSSTWFDIVWI